MVAASHPAVAVRVAAASTSSRGRGGRRVGGCWTGVLHMVDNGAWRFDHGVAHRGHPAGWSDAHRRRGGRGEVGADEARRTAGLSFKSSEARPPCRGSRSTAAAPHARRRSRTPPTDGAAAGPGSLTAPTLTSMSAGEPLDCSHDPHQGRRRRRSSCRRGIPRDEREGDERRLSGHDRRRDPRGVASDTASVGRVGLHRRLASAGRGTSLTVTPPRVGRQGVGCPELPA